MENGGLVLGGRWYGLCPGPPNRSEFELLDAGTRGLIYCYVANPGAYVITTQPRSALSAPQIRRVMGGTSFFGQLAKSACAYPSLVVAATTRSVSDMHQLTFGGCKAHQLVTITGGQGAW